MTQSSRPAIPGTRVNLPCSTGGVWSRTGKSTLRSAALTLDELLGRHNTEPSFRRLAIKSANKPIPSRPNVLGSGTANVASVEIVKSVPTKVANELGLLNSSVMTSLTEIARPVRAAAPPDPDNRSKGKSDVNESRPDTLPPVNTPPFSVTLQSELRT